MTNSGKRPTDYPSDAPVYTNAEIMMAQTIGKENRIEASGSFEVSKGADGKWTYQSARFGTVRT